MMMVSRIRIVAHDCASFTTRNCKGKTRSIHSFLHWHVCMCAVKCLVHESQNTIMLYAEQAWSCSHNDFMRTLLLSLFLCLIHTYHKAHTPHSLSLSVSHTQTHTHTHTCSLSPSLLTHIYTHTHTQHGSHWENSKSLKCQGDQGAYPPPKKKRRKPGLKWCTLAYILYLVVIYL